MSVPVKNEIMPPMDPREKEIEKQKIEELLEIASYDVNLDASMIAMYSLAGENPPAFKMDEIYLDYLHLDTAERQHFLKSIARYVRRPCSNNDLLARQHEKFTMKIKLNAATKALLKYKTQSKEQATTALRFMAQKTFVMIHHKKGVVAESVLLEMAERSDATTIPDSVNNFPNIYVPPERRICIIDNITFNEYNIIPVYTDVSKETLENLVIPENMTFDYTDANVVNKAKEKRLAIAIRMSEEDPQNVIRCDCHEQSVNSGKLIACYENPKCPCYQMNHRMREMQEVVVYRKNHPVKRKERLCTEFATYKPILFSCHRDIFYVNCGYACSELCGCKGRCTNNVLMTIDQRIYPLEMYRENKEMGFNVRCPVFIPAGTPIMDFTGEIMQEANLPSSHVEYAHKSHFKDDVKWIKLIKESKFSADYKEILLNLYKKDWNVDPTNVGNIGRTVSHSCVPNLEVIRIFQKSLSPAHVRLVMVTLQDIYPGTPFSIDYGVEYQERLRDYCACRTFACKNSDKEADMKKLTDLQLLRGLERVANIQHERWMEMIETIYAPRRNRTT